MRKTIFLAVMTALLLTACTDKKEKMIEMAKENVRQNVKDPASVQFTATAQPDSVFGMNYLPESERRNLLKLMDLISNTIMQKTDNMTKMEPIDHYVMDLAQRQLQIGPVLAQLIQSQTPKGEFSGWRVKVDFSAKGEHDITYKGERWVYFSIDGKEILNSFELPIP